MKIELTLKELVKLYIDQTPKLSQTTYMFRIVDNDNDDVDVDTNNLKIVIRSSNNNCK